MLGADGACMGLNKARGTNPSPNPLGDMLGRDWCRRRGKRSRYNLTSLSLRTCNTILLSVWLLMCMVMLEAEPIKISNVVYLCFYNLSAHVCLKWNTLNITQRRNQKKLTRTPCFWPIADLIPRKSFRSWAIFLILPQKSHSTTIVPLSTYSTHL